MAADTEKEEVMKVKGSRRIVRRLGLALAVAAVFAPAAQAVPMDPDTYQVLQSRQYADDVRVAPPTRKYADDLHAVSTPTVTEHRGYAPINERAVPQSEPRGYAPINERARPDLPQPVSVAVVNESRFDWSDAGIGAVFTFGLMILLGSGLLLAGRHTRRSRLAAV
ncbi:MAG TPA: hypothetical protein VE615_07300 [Gaiellaceae bacterium]|nr:hypothetical protein [Gaiellaceae bacterium]